MNLSTKEDKLIDKNYTPTIPARIAALIVALFLLVFLLLVRYLQALHYQAHLRIERGIMNFSASMYPNGKAVLTGKL